MLSPRIITLVAFALGLAALGTTPGLQGRLSAAPLPQFEESGRQEVNSGQIEEVVIDGDESTLVIFFGWKNPEGGYPKYLHLRHVPRDIALSLVHFKGKLELGWKEGNDRQSHYEATLKGPLTFRPDR
jgi:hypothetical protein